MVIRSHISIRRLGLLGLSLVCLFCLTLQVAAKEFVVVIDAGHGGHDPGAIGKISKEKNINLKVALKLGGLIKLNCDDVKVVYTRTRDLFIPLDRRAEIANDAKADLFISIHTNALAKNRTAQGPSTWTLGLAKSDDNLEVAKRENGVILYENDYETRYAGFNPNSAESYIIFEFMQDKYMSQSVHLAQLVQKQFKTHCKRQDRGVHQAGFLVLKASAMPSILVELGFISTPAEERYLNTESGTSTLAEGIYKAFLTYKKEQELRHKESSDKEKKAANSQQASEKPVANGKQAEDKRTTEDQTAASGKPAANAKPAAHSKPSTSTEVVFKVQIATSSSKLSTKDKRFKGVSLVEMYQEKGMYKYTSGTSTNYYEVLQTKRQLEKRFKGAFIIAFQNGQKIDAQKAAEAYKKAHPAHR